jgi:hypothetical protein
LNNLSLLYEPAYFQHQEFVFHHLVCHCIWFKIFAFLAKAENLMLDHKKLNRKNTELQQQNEKLQNDM